MSRGRRLPRRARDRARDDQGAATILVLAIASLAVFVAVAVFALSIVAGARAKASAAADAAALAGTTTLALSPLGDACAAAVDAAHRNGARLESCRVQGKTIAVSVAYPTRYPGLPDAHAHARAMVDWPFDH